MLMHEVLVGNVADIRSKATLVCLLLLMQGQFQSWRLCCQASFVQCNNRGLSESKSPLLPQISWHFNMTGK